MEKDVKGLAHTLILFRGAGDVATGAAVRLYGAGLRRLVFLEIPKPLAVRRSVSFSEAVYNGETVVEGIRAVYVASPDEALAVLDRAAGLPVLVDEQGSSVSVLRPEVVVEATLAKRNIGVTLADAPLVIGLGPGFTAGIDVHRVVETCRGHSMGRLIRQGSALPNTGKPGVVMGFDVERVLRAPCAGVFETDMDLGHRVCAGQCVGTVDGQPVCAAIGGVLRGLLRSGIGVDAGAKIGDVEPRDNVGIDRVSDKGLAAGGALLEAVLEYSLLTDH